MTYESLDFHSYTVIPLAFAVLLLGFMIIMMFSSDPVEWFTTRRAFITIPILVIGIGGFLFGADKTGDVFDSNTQIASENIMKKYKIQEVQWAHPKSSAVSTTTIANKELVAKADNGQTYIFGYAVNKETSEPMLSNMPIPAGISADNNTSVEELLKEPTK